MSAGSSQRRLCFYWKLRQDCTHVGCHKWVSRPSFYWTRWKYYFSSLQPKRKTSGFSRRCRHDHLVGSRIWPIKKRMRGHAKGGIWSLSWSMESTVLASGGADGTVRIWDIEPAADAAGQGRVLAEEVQGKRSWKTSKGKPVVPVRRRKGRMSRSHLTRSALFLLRKVQSIE